jgi:cbb3-type cytochrome oxidase subunit 3
MNWKWWLAIIWLLVMGFVIYAFWRERREELNAKKK